MLYNHSVPEKEQFKEISESLILLWYSCPWWAYVKFWHQLHVLQWWRLGWDEGKKSQNSKLKTWLWWLEIQVDGNLLDHKSEIFVSIWVLYWGVMGRSVLLILFIQWCWLAFVQREVLGWNSNSEVWKTVCLVVFLKTLSFLTLPTKKMEFVYVCIKGSVCPNPLLTFLAMAYRLVKKGDTLRVI